MAWAAVIIHTILNGSTAIVSWTIFTDLPPRIVYPSVLGITTSVLIIICLATAKVIPYLRKKYPRLFPVLEKSKWSGWLFRNIDSQIQMNSPKFKTIDRLQQWGVFLGACLPWFGIGPTVAVVHIRQIRYGLLFLIIGNNLKILFCNGLIEKIFF